MGQIRPVAARRAGADPPRPRAAAPRRPGCAARPAAEFPRCARPRARWICVRSRGGGGRGAGSPAGAGVRAVSTGAWRPGARGSRTMPRAAVSMAGGLRWDASIPAGFFGDGQGAARARAPPPPPEPRRGAGLALPGVPQSAQGNAPSCGQQLGGRALTRAPAEQCHRGREERCSGSFRRPCRRARPPQRRRSRPRSPAHPAPFLLTCALTVRPQPSRPPVAFPPRTRHGAPPCAALRGAPPSPRRGLTAPRARAGRGAPAAGALERRRAAVGWRQPCPERERESERERERERKRKRERA